MLPNVAKCCQQNLEHPRFRCTPIEFAYGDVIPRKVEPVTSFRRPPQYACCAEVPGRLSSWKIVLEVFQPYGRSSPMWKVDEAERFRSTMTTNNDETIHLSGLNLQSQHTGTASTTPLPLTPSCRLLQCQTPTPVAWQSIMGRKLESLAR